MAKLTVKELREQSSGTPASAELAIEIDGKRYRVESIHEDVISKYNPGGHWMLFRLRLIAGEEIKNYYSEDPRE